MKLARLIVAAALVGSAALAHALDIKPYSADALANAEKAGQPVALHFRADWCPTCRAQDKALQSLKAEKGLDITVLSVNYDTEKDMKRRFKISSQSTLVVLKGDKESARLVGDTSSLNIMMALKSAL
ncbi:MAG: thioredoxin family protein [Piscinibacter sp.]|uniref:thioredoxin family protein n=1 Tax=Piscinibacter sp. TaxID=1903157 RepID=UPI003D0F84F3